MEVARVWGVISEGGVAVVVGAGVEGAVRKAGAKGVVKFSAEVGLEEGGEVEKK